MSVLYLLDLGSNDQEQTLPSDAKEELEPSSTSRVNLLYQLRLLLYLSKYEDSLLILESKILLLLTWLAIMLEQTTLRLYTRQRLELTILCGLSYKFKNKQNLSVRSGL